MSQMSFLLVDGSGKQQKIEVHIHIKTTKLEFLTSLPFPSLDNSQPKWSSNRFNKLLQ